MAVIHLSLPDHDPQTDMSSISSASARIELHIKARWLFSFLVDIHVPVANALHATESTRNRRRSILGQRDSSQELAPSLHRQNGAGPASALVRYQRL